MFVEFCVDVKRKENVIIKRRDWRNYSKDILNAKLSSTDWNIDIDDVQNDWNAFENKLINIEQQYHVALIWLGLVRWVGIW